MSQLIVSCHTTAINRFNFLKDRCGIQLKVIKSSKSSEHLSLHVPSTHVPPCLVISFTRISRGPSHHKSGSLNNKYEHHSDPLNIPKHSRKSAANVRTPSITSSEPRPKRPGNPSEATAAVVGRGPPWPLQRSAARPRRRGLPEPPNAAASGLGAPRMRRGRSSSCDCRGETRRSNGMFLRVVGQNSEYRS